VLLFLAVFFREVKSAWRRIGKDVESLDGPDGRA
jgi:hypothetical protein